MPCVCVWTNRSVFTHLLLPVLLVDYSIQAPKETLPMKRVTVNRKTEVFVRFILRLGNMIYAFELPPPLADELPFSLFFDISVRHISEPKWRSNGTSPIFFKSEVLSLNPDNDHQRMIAYGCPSLALEPERRQDKLVAWN